MWDTPGMAGEAGNLGMVLDRTQDSQQFWDVGKERDFPGITGREKGLD